MDPIDFNGREKNIMEVNGVQVTDILQNIFFVFKKKETDDRIYFLK